MNISVCINIKSKLTSIPTNVSTNVVIGLGVGKTLNISSCTKPPVITADLTIFIHPK